MYRILKSGVDHYTRPIPNNPIVKKEENKIKYTDVYIQFSSSKARNQKN